jgi:hypothetical protein
MTAHSQSLHQRLRHWKLIYDASLGRANNPNYLIWWETNKDAYGTSLVDGVVVYLASFGGNGVFIGTNYEAATDLNDPGLGFLLYNNSYGGVGSFVGIIRYLLGRTEKTA